jgi:hypothetical protein
VGSHWTARHGSHPRTYEAMFSLPSGLAFSATGSPAAMTRAFAALRAAFPDPDGTRTEVVWSLLHGLSTLGAGGRLTPGAERERLELAHRFLTREPADGEAAEQPGPHQALHQP